MLHLPPQHATDPTRMPGQIVAPAPAPAPAPADQAYTVFVQYPYTVWYEQIITVRAASEDDARVAAIREADKDWDQGYRSCDGEAGKTEVFRIVRKD